MKNGVTADDLKRAKAQLQAELALEAESNGCWLERNAAGILETGKLPASAEEINGELQRLSLEDVNGAARRALNGKAAYAAVGGLEHVPTLDEL